MYLLKCPECRSSNLNTNSAKGECICRNCGLVVDDSMPTSQERYAEGSSENGTQFVDGKIVKGAWLLTAKEKNLYHAKKRLNLLASRINLPKYIKEQAYHIYEKAVEKSLGVGRDNSSILHACVYIACNQNEIPKTAVEITEYSYVDKKHLLRACSLLQKELGLKISIYDPADLLPRFTTHLGLSYKSLAKATQLLDNIKGTSAYSGKNPKSIVAAVIYIAAKLCKEKISQREIANQVGVMEVTIRKRYKEIVKTLNI